MKMDRFAHRTVAAATDEALCAWPVPAECTVRGVKAKVSCVGAVGQITTSVNPYAVNGWLLELPDDLLETAVDAIMDAVIPKYTGTLGFDFDDEGTTTSPEFEPGEIRNELLGANDMPEHIYQRRKYIEFPDVGSYHVVTEHTLFHFIPRDRFSISRTGNKRADGNSALAFSFSSPANDALVTETKLFPSFGGTGRSEWIWLRMLDQILEYAIVAMLALTQAGAETPYQNLLDLLEAMISSANSMDGGTYVDNLWHVNMVGTMDFYTPGSIRIRLASD